VCVDPGGKKDRGEEEEEEGVTATPTEGSSAPNEGVGSSGAVRRRRSSRVRTMLPHLVDEKPNESVKKSK
jgi:hypothetical protein